MFAVMHEELIQTSQLRTLLINGDARRIRLRSSLSLSEMARALEVSPPTLSRWERQQRMPRQKAALRYLALIEELEEASQ